MMKLFVSFSGADPEDHEGKGRYCFPESLCRIQNPHVSNVIMYSKDAVHFLLKFISETSCLFPPAKMYICVPSRHPELSDEIMDICDVI